MTRFAITRSVAFFVACVLSLALVACKPAAPEADKAAPVKLSAPTGADDAQWKAYVSQVVSENDDNVTDRVYAYYLPANSDVPGEDGTSQYGRQLDQVVGVVARTVLPGNLLVFASPDSAKVADLVVAAFTDAKPDALKGSQVLFVGQVADRDRVKAAAEAAGAKFVFVEAK